LLQPQREHSITCHPHRFPHHDHSEGVKESRGSERPPSDSWRQLDLDLDMDLDLDLDLDLGFSVVRRQRVVA
jgi:hypothetical protein